MSKQLRENEVMLRSAKSTEECAVLKLQQVEFERDSLKSHYDNSKLLIKNLESEHKTLETLYHEIENTLKEKIEENLMLNLELDSYDQKVFQNCVNFIFIVVCPLFLFVVCLYVFLCEIYS